MFLSHLFLHTFFKILPVKVHLSEPNMEEWNCVRFHATFVHCSQAEGEYCNCLSLYLEEIRFSNQFQVRLNTFLRRNFQNNLAQHAMQLLIQLLLECLLLRNDLYWHKNDHWLPVPVNKNHIMRYVPHAVKTLMHSTHMCICSIFCQQGVFLSKSSNGLFWRIHIQISCIFIVVLFKISQFDI